MKIFWLIRTRPSGIGIQIIVYKLFMNNLKNVEQFIRNLYFFHLNALHKFMHHMFYL